MVFFKDFEPQDVFKYLEAQFETLIEEDEINMNPADLVAHLFEVAGVLYGGITSFKDDVLYVLTKKTEDYNADKIHDPEFRLDSARYDYFPFGSSSYLQMLHTKIHRMRSVMLKDEANYESVEDSLIDLGSYLIFYYSYLVERDAIS